MKLIARHYLREFIKTFCFLCLGLTSLITIIFAFRDTGELGNTVAQSDPGALVFMRLSLLEVPANIVTVMPVTVLVAALLVVGSASGARELVAVTASGGRLKRLLSPLLTAGIVLSVLSFGLGELAVPACARKSLEIKSELMGIKNRLMVTGGNIWLRTEDGSMARLGFYSRETDTYGDISIFKARRGRLLTVLRAREAAYMNEQGTWQLTSVSVHTLGSSKVKHYDTLDYPNLPEPTELTEGQNYTSRMGALEMMSYLRKLKSAGFRNRELSMELQSRFSSPMLNLVMVLLGVAVAARRSLGTLKASAIGVLVTALYWLLMSVSSTLGLTGVLPYTVAAWLSPAVFLSAAGWLYMKIPE